MEKQLFSEKINQWVQSAQAVAADQATYIQIGIILSVYLFSYFVHNKIVSKKIFNTDQDLTTVHPIKRYFIRLSGLFFPLLAILLLRLTSEFAQYFQFTGWILNTAMAIAIMLFCLTIIREFVTSEMISLVFRWIGLPILMLHLLGVLPWLIKVLEEISLKVGNIEVSLYGFFRVLLFGTLLFWLGRTSSSVGKDMIRNHQSLDISTKEIFSKLFEVALFCLGFVILLNIMGINLTALTVFGGAVGVGLGLGLQSIASNFISGIIILLDKSLTVGDYVELADGRKGFVREFKMRYAVLETYDGKDILVPNETFISSSMVNWTHKDPKQRYRVDFSVAYETDIRAMVELIKEAVATHPQVISGPEIPFEERPDCEIDSFGDSGVNMFVEFWMVGVDDGKNRVGGDLLLIIFETLRENNITIPFPQREVRILNADEYPKSSSE